MILFAVSVAASAQMNMSMNPSAKMTDAQKIADALRAGPDFVTNDAVIADWPPNPKDPHAEYRILRPGKAS